MVSSAFIRRSAAGACIILLGALAAVPAEAAQGAGPRSGPCSEDMAKYCRDVQPGGGRILKCMQEHENELSPGCKQHVAEMKERAKEVRQACSDDVMQFCKDVQPGQGRIASCLKQHENELSADCKAHMGNRKGRRQQ